LRVNRRCERSKKQKTCKHDACWNGVCHASLLDEEHALRMSLAYARAKRSRFGNNVCSGRLV
jgi:hypothetical protein